MKALSTIIVVLMAAMPHLGYADGSVVVLAVAEGASSPFEGRSVTSGPGCLPPKGLDEGLIWPLGDVTTSAATISVGFSTGMEQFFAGDLTTAAATLDEAFQAWRSTPWGAPLGSGNEGEVFNGSLCLARVHLAAGDEAAAEEVAATVASTFGDAAPSVAYFPESFVSWYETLRASVTATTVAVSLVDACGKASPGLVVDGVALAPDESGTWHLGPGPHTLVPVVEGVPLLGRHLDGSSATPTSISVCASLETQLAKGGIGHLLLERPAAGITPAEVAFLLEHASGGASEVVVVGTLGSTAQTMGSVSGRRYDATGASEPVVVLYQSTDDTVTYSWEPIEPTEQPSLVGPLVLGGVAVALVTAGAVFNVVSNDLVEEQNRGYVDNTSEVESTRLLSIGAYSLGGLGLGGALSWWMATR